MNRNDDVFYQAFLTPLEVASLCTDDCVPETYHSMSCPFCCGLMFSHSHQEYLLIPYSDALLDRASALIARYVLRALDAVQLASALELRDGLPADALPLRFLSADDKLLDAARQEHLQAQNPEKARF